MDEAPSMTTSRSLIEGASSIVQPTRRRSAMEKAEPPSQRSSPHSSLFRVGKNSHGNWVVQDQQGLRGGIFVDRAEALKFAMFENGNRPQAVIMVPGVLELDMSAKALPGRHATANAHAPLQRVA